MSVNLSIKGGPEELAARLRERAAKNHRSLQGELLAIIESAVRAPDAGAGPAAPASRSGRRTLEQIVADREARSWKPAGWESLPLAVDIIRADRDNR